MECERAISSYFKIIMSSVDRPISKKVFHFSHFSPEHDTINIKYEIIKSKQTCSGHSNTHNLSREKKSD